MTHDVILFLAAFLACAVEMVEALTIVLAVGVTRGWRSAIIGSAAALVTLAAVVVVFGPALTKLPIGDLRLVIGAVLLVFGLQWLRKAILRASGFKALHDEDAIFAEEQRAAQAVSPAASGLDWYSFTVSFKGVFLEGLEVAFIVVVFGSAQHNISLAALGAVAAAVVVLTVGLVVHRPLSRVPENTMKFGVGVMLTTFGTFWATEGAGVQWPGNDASLVGLLAYVLATSVVLASVLRRRHERLVRAGAVA
jgi:uncharacterized membrane protein